MSNKEIHAHSTDENTEPGRTADADKAPRILARQLARPLTTEEIEFVAGGLRARGGGTCSAGTCVCPDCDD